MKLVAVIALLRTEELVSGGNILGRKSILRTIDSSGGGNSLRSNLMMLCGELLGWRFLLVSSRGSEWRGTRVLILFSVKN